MDEPHNHSVLSPDKTSLFCTSGMHHYKNQFKDKSYFSTFTNIQKVLRFNDLDEVLRIGEGNQYRHRLIFHMVGLFGFREITLKQSIDFVLSFLSLLQIKPDYITIHQDKYDEWKEYYSEYDIPIVIDSENCTWSDGENTSYCTELFYKNIEIGNIVNPYGDCIDTGLGMERLIMLSPIFQVNQNNHEYNNYHYLRQEILLETAYQLIQELDILSNKNIHLGTQFIHKGAGFHLKKLLVKLLEDMAINGNYLIHYVDSQSQWLELQHHELWQRVFQNKRSKVLYLLQQKALNSKIWRTNGSEFWESVHGINPKIHQIISQNNHNKQQLLDFFDI